MRKSLLFLFTIICITLSTLVFANQGNGHGNGGGHGNNSYHNGNYHHGYGYNHSGKYPPGLAKQGKVPAGWSKSEKEGWENKTTYRTPYGPAVVVPER